MTKKQLLEEVQRLNNLLDNIKNKPNYINEDQVTVNRLSLIINQFSGGIVIETPERKVSLANNEFCEIFGIKAKPETLKGTDCSQVYLKSKSIFKDYEGFIARINEIIDNGKTVRNEKIQLNNGRMLERDYVRIEVEPGISENLWLYRDITYRKKANKTIQQSEEIYRTFFETTAEGILAAKLETMDFIYANPAICKMLGYSQNELLNLSVADIHPEEAVGHVIQEFESQVKGEKVTVFHIPCLRKDGSVIFANITSKKMNIMNQECNVGFFTDITDQKRFEEQLHVTELIINRGPAILFSWKVFPNFWSIQHVSGNVERILGYTVEEFTSGKVSWLGIMHPDDVSQIISEMEKYVKKGINDWSLEYRIITRKGNIRWMKDWNLVLTNSGGEITGIETIMIDITDRKQIEKELKESEKRYRTLSEDSPVGIIVHSEGKITYINTAALKLIGAKSENEILGKQAMEFVHPDYHKVVQERVNKLYEQKEINPAPTLEEKFIRLDGKTIDVEVTGKVVKFMGKPASQVIIQDITSRKQAEKLLHESEERFKRLFNDLGDAVFVTKMGGADRGTILEVNPSAEQQTGYSREELIGMNIITDLAVVGSAEISLDDWEERMLKGEKVTSIEKKRKKNGEEYWTEVVVTPIEFLGLKAGLSINHDISVRRQLQEQLNQSHKMEAVGRLAGGVAHDFNNLLTVINGYCDLLLNKDLPEKIRESVEQIHKSGGRAARLTSQLLAFSRKQIIRPKILNLNDLILDQYTMLGRLLGEDIEINLHLCPHKSMIKVDPGQMEQIIMNIAVNARDAMPFGGNLMIETSNMEFDEHYTQKHPGAKQGRYIMLAISDNGIGMDEATCSHIFEPFYTTKGRDKGTGLGLSTVYGVVKQNKGMIYVYSELQIGTTFKIYLPQVEETNKISKSSTVNVSELNGNKTILLVEDDADVLELTRSILSNHGYTVLTAENGEEALLIHRNYKGNIDLLLTDVIMPSMGGKELSKYLLKENPMLKVLYSSGYTDSAIAHHGVLDDGVEFIQKPYTHVELAQKIRDVLNN